MNNRPIKFRAWDTKNKKWLTAVPSLEYLLDDEDECVSHHDIDLESAIYSYPHNLIGDTFDDRVIWQQFTGLKDSTGKEIYEGDIVSWKCCRDVEEIFQVVWDNFYCGFAFALKDGAGLNHTGFKLTNSRHGNDNYQLIGNIFETPELLA